MTDIGQRRLCRRLLIGGVTVTILVYLKLAFLQPGSFAYAPFTIEDDARQFLLWMPRLRDPALLQNDLMASYWHSVSPLLYRLPFQAVAALGVDPVLFGRFLAVPLLALAAWGAWRLAMELTAGRPVAAFVAASFLLGFILHEDSIYTASPRAFSHVLLLFFFDALLRDRASVILVTLFLLAGLYPAPAMTAFTVLALSRVRMSLPPGIDLSRRSILLVGTAALLVVIAVLPFAMQTDPWGPALTLDQARTMPNLMTPGGRSTLVDDSGAIGWVCSWRMGFVPTLVPCNRGIPGALFINLLLFLPLLIFAFNAVRGRPDKAAATRNRIYGLALVAAALWYCITLAVAFRLHLPSRYSQRILEPLEWLAIGQMIGLWIDRRLQRQSAKPAVRMAAVGLALLIAISFASPKPGMRRPADPALIREVATLPAGSMIAGVSEELNFIPALTGRAVLATPEHAIPYQLGYYRPIAERLRASLAAVSTADPKVLRHILVRYRIDFLLVERAMLGSSVIAGRYSAILPDETAAASASLRRHAPAILLQARDCTVYSDQQFLLLDARCLLARL